MFSISPTDLCGITPVEAETGRATWTMPASEWLCAPVPDRLYGGAIAMLADGRDLVARGTVIHRGRGMAVGTSEVFDAGGKKVAVATGSAVLLPGRPATVTTELALPQPDGNEDAEDRPIPAPVDDRRTAP